MDIGYNFICRTVSVCVIVEVCSYMRHSYGHWLSFYRQTVSVCVIVEVCSYMRHSYGHWLSFYRQNSVGVCHRSVVFLHEAFVWTLVIIL